MNYKVYISGYLEESNQLLVSFSSDNTQREAKDYPSLAFDLVPYGDVSVQEILENIAKVAPTYCSDTVVVEAYQGDDARADELRALVGQSFSYTENDLFPSQAADEREAQANVNAEQAEEI